MAPDTGVSGFAPLGRTRLALAHPGRSIVQHRPLAPPVRKGSNVNRIVCLVGSLVLIACLVSAAQAEITLGVLGDSLSDEYSEEVYDYALNWVEQLVTYGVADVGPTAAEAGLSTWEEPRRTGYEYNWAHSGAVTADLAQYQVDGVLSQVGPKGITHVVGLIGANDFFPLGDTYSSIYHGTADPAEIEADIATNIAAVTAAMQDLKAAGVKLVWATLPDYALAPLTRAVYLDPAKRERVTTVIREVNHRLIDLAVAEEVPVVDAFGISKAVFGENGSENSTLRMGNVELQLLQFDTAGNTRPTAAFVHDAVHPHTTVQGVLSALFVEAFNLGYGDQIPLPSEEEILSHAGIAYGGQDTLLAELGADSYADFIIVPEPSVFVLLSMGVFTLVAYRQRRRQPV